MSWGRLALTSDKGNAYTLGRKQCLALMLKKEYICNSKR